MTVALPPPLPPQQDELALVRRAAADETIAFEGYRIHLHSAGALDAEQARRAVAAADTLSNAVRALARACYEAGYPGARLHYALDGEDLYVMVELAPLTGLRAPPELMPYFEALPEGRVLTDAALEPRRVLADVHADRAGITAEARLEPAAEGQVLDVAVLGTDDDRTVLGAAVSNYGNRFVGRHFLDLDASHTRPSGDAFEIRWTTGLSGLNSEGAERYNEESLTWSRVTPQGLFGLSGRIVDYDRRVAGSTINGDLDEAQATWSYPIAATWRSRWIIDARIDYTRKRQAAASVDLSAQDERYPSLELGNQYSYSALWMGLSWDLEAALALRHGLRGETGGDGAEFDYFLWRPKLRADVELRNEVTAAAAIALQLSRDRVPEQSQWVLGGINNIHAYLPGVAVGDSGGIALLQIEYRLPAYRDVQFVPRGFVEYGYARNEHARPGLPRGTVALADAGVEIGARLLPWLAASLAAAVPLHHDGISRAERERYEADVLFKVAASF